MKPDIHPEYRDVVFHDTTSDSYFVKGSTLKTDRAIDYQGATYPYMTIDVSSKSHPIRLLMRPVNLAYAALFKA